MDIHEFIRKLNVKTLVEIGAHFAEDTVIFRASHPTARIVAFEPDPRNIALIRTLGRDTLCELYPLALSNSNGQQTFHLSSGYLSGHPDKMHRDNPYSSSSSLKKPTAYLGQILPELKFEKDTTVDCVRLDDFAPLTDTTIDFIWADVQGAEDLVFGGATETLKRTRFVYTEYATGLYDGQLNKAQLLALFGKDWVVVHDYGNGHDGDILLKNSTIA
jgi:FkbM family methyltransferase